MGSDVLTFLSWGFELYLPPNAFSTPPARPRFVMLDDLNDVFYDVDYETALLGNQTSWTDLAIHKIRDAAIVFPPEQQDMLQMQRFATGLLVSIESRTSEMIIAKKVGRVNVKPLPQEFMNWSALTGLKGKELPAEMRAGLLRRVWNRRPVTGSQSSSFVTPSRILNAMPRPWHRDGVALSYELDDRFVGGKAVGPPSVWRVSGLDAEQIAKSRHRAAVFIVN
jgi:hypothetical protein